MPKKMAVDVIVIICIVIMVILVPLVFFIGLFPLFVGEPVTPPATPQKPVNVEIKIPSEISPGENVSLNISVTNLGDEPVENITLELLDSKVFVGTTVRVDEILPRMTKDLVMVSQVKADAPTGLATGSLIVSVGNYSETKLAQIKVVE